MYPKILSANIHRDYKLLIKFDNQQKKEYDFLPLLEKPMFYPLKDKRLFNKFHIEKGGYALIWNEFIDISEYELWCNGKSIY
jgi:hypothetical protein